MLMMLMLPVMLAAEEDLASLDRLADIIILSPISWWPLAHGWYVVISALLLLLIVAVILMWQLKRHNAYRVAALAELNQAGKGVGALPKIAQILKRTALSIVEREQVASLTGEQWLQWLNQTGNGVIFSEKSKQILSEQLYSVGQVDDADIDTLIRTARDWINKHKLEPMPITALSNNEKSTLRC